MAFKIGGDHADNAVFNGRETKIFLVDEQETSCAAKKHFGILWALRFQELDQRVKTLLIGGNALNFLACLLYRGIDTLLIKRFKDVVYRIDLKSFDGVLIKIRGEDNLRKPNLLVE